jgi:hypothetical protein
LNHTRHARLIRWKTLTALAQTQTASAISDTASHSPSARQLQVDVFPSCLTADPRRDLMKNDVAFYELKPANNQQVEDENALSDLEITRAARSQYQALFFLHDQSSTVAARVWLQVIDIAEAGTEFSRNVVPRL